MREVYRELKIEGENFKQLETVLLENVNASIRVEAAKARMNDDIKAGDATSAIENYAVLRNLQYDDIASRQAIWTTIARLFPESNFPVPFDGSFKDKITHAVCEWTETVYEADENLAKALQDDEPDWDENDVVNEAEAPARL